MSVTNVGLKLKYTLQDIPKWRRVKAGNEEQGAIRDFYAPVCAMNKGISQLGFGAEAGYGE